ncbi:MAG: FAD-binding oxidoreductase [Candidatus Omnitrophota bacterium]|nr:FAD-binding oxidoreductase [Candidatus Omnitrophota bacterium]
MLIKKDRDAIKSYFEDSSNLKGGYADSVAFPEDINALSKLIKDANIKRVPVTVSGGGTGTTGSRIPFGGIVVSLEKFNEVLEISDNKLIARVEAGCSVEHFKAECEKRGLFYACHPTERGAFLGGTVATNASGARSFKYGPTRRYVKHIKMVLADGQIFEISRGEKFLTKKDSKIPLPTYKIPDIKNSAGYFIGEGADLIDLFIGQEGTLSIITEMDLALLKIPMKILSSFAFFDKNADSWNFASEARRLSRSQNKAGVDALSIEYLDENALNLLRLRSNSVPSGANAAIFFEQEVTQNDEGRAVDAWLKLISKHNASADDTWVAMTEEGAEKFNQLRHSIPESVNEIVRRNGFRKLSTDIAVPEKNFAKMTDFYTATLKKENVGHIIFGHIGECHLHVNLLPKNDEERERSEKICLEFARKGVSLGGTVSAEHGIGKTRHKYLEIMYGRQGILEMARVKKVFDPNCILGLDNIFPKEVLKEA